jgi:hypothetical protein
VIEVDVDAGLYVASPALIAVTVQVPAASAVTVSPATEQAPGVEEVTVRDPVPEPPVTLIVWLDPTIMAVLAEIESAL